MCGSEFQGNSIDRADTLLLPRQDAVHGWLLSTSTPIISKMYLSKPLPPLPPTNLNDSLNSRKQLNRLVPCPLYFDQPQNRLSTSSESSDPGMVEDPLCWSGSDTTVEEQQHSEAELWDSYFWSQDNNNLQNSFHQLDARANLPSRMQETNSPSRMQETNLSPCNRNFAFVNLSGLNVNECPAELHRSDATRAPRRTPKSLPKNTYSPFPAVSLPTQSHESTHKSWPTRCDSQTQPRELNPPSHPLKNPTDREPVLQSNLSTCSTLDDRYSPQSSASSASGLYMRSAPVSPGITPPLIEVMEKSYFDDDSDDEESRLVLFATKLNIRSASANNSSRTCKERTLRSQKSRKNLKSAGDALRGIFGKKRSAGIM